MPRLSPRYAHFAYAIIQAAITTAMATAIATRQLTEFGMLFLSKWALSWGLAWVTMLPVVMIVAPLIQRAVAAMTDQAAPPGRS